jgi:hypothetical protein
MPRHELPDPTDFTITDVFRRVLRFYIRDGKYCRITCDIHSYIADDGQPIQVSKMVYAMQYLDACLSVVGD